MDNLTTTKLCESAIEIVTLNSLDKEEYEKKVLSFLSRVYGVKLPEQNKEYLYKSFYGKSAITFLRYGETSPESIYNPINYLSFAADLWLDYNLIKMHRISSPELICRMIFDKKDEILNYNPYIDLKSFDIHMKQLVSFVREVGDSLNSYVSIISKGRKYYETAFQTMKSFFERVGRFQETFTLLNPFQTEELTNSTPLTQAEPELLQKNLPDSDTKPEFAEYESHLKYLQDLVSEQETTIKQMNHEVLVRIINKLGSREFGYPLQRLYLRLDDNTLPAEAENDIKNLFLALSELKIRFFWNEEHGVIVTLTEETFKKYQIENNSPIDAETPVEYISKYPGVRFNREIIIKPTIERKSCNGKPAY